jgi:hypothetical protein
MRVSFKGNLKLVELLMATGATKRKLKIQVQVTWRLLYEKHATADVFYLSRRRAMAIYER